MARRFGRPLGRRHARRRHDELQRQTRFRGSSENLYIVERFSRIDAITLRYQFTIEDPQTWVRSWSGEEGWPEANALLYEYACHEGNYALGDILRGARLREAERTKQ